MGTDAVFAAEDVVVTADVGFAEAVLEGFFDFLDVVFGDGCELL
jgi:hypothetical protein